MKKNKLIISSLLMFLVGCTAPNDSSSSVDNNKSYDIKVWCAEAAVELTNKQLNDFKKENSSLKVNFNVQAISEAEAANKLKALNLEVALESEEEPHEEIEKGKVIGTNPVIGRQVKEGTKITLIISTGLKTYEVVDFTGKNYIEVETELEKI